MGNLEKILVVGVLVVVIAILAVSLFWTSDVATLPEMGTGTSTSETGKPPESPISDLSLPSQPLSTVSGDPSNAAPSEGGSSVGGDNIGYTPSLITTQPYAGTASSPGEELFKSYAVKSGDTLGGIAKREGVKLSELLKANEGLDPKKLRIGQTILIPKDAMSAAPLSTKEASSAKPADTATPAKTETYVVQKGDTLWKIAQRFYGDGSKWKKVQEANKDKLPNENALRVGMKLTLP